MVEPELVQVSICGIHSNVNGFHMMLNALDLESPVKRDLSPTTLSRDFQSWSVPEHSGRPHHYKRSTRPSIDNSRPS